MIKTETAHIWLDDRRVEWIDASNTKVKEVVIERTSWDMSPETIQRQHPHLSLAQIHAALANYYDHQAEIDAEIQRDFEEVERLRATAHPPFTRKGLEARLRR